MARRAALVALAALLVLPAAARADGDPASDFLISERVFLPYDTKISSTDQQRLTGTVLAATRSGFRIRVALIGTDYDLGSVTVLWKQPQTYAHFLGVELSFIHTTPLLTVMPNGMGFYWKGHDPRAANALLATITVPPGGAGLAQAAVAAVKKLAALYGVRVGAPVKVASQPASSAHRNRDDRIIIIAVVAALLVAGITVRLVLNAGRPR